MVSDLFSCTSRTLSSRFSFGSKARYREPCPIFSFFTYGYQTLREVGRPIQSSSLSSPSEFFFFSMRRSRTASFFGLIDWRPTAVLYGFRYLTLASIDLCTTLPLLWSGLPPPPFSSQPLSIQRVQLPFLSSLFFSNIFRSIAQVF